MKTLTTTLALIGAVTLALSTTPAHAACPVSNGSVRILGNDFPAIQAVAAGAESCAANAEFSKNLTSEHLAIAVEALTVNPAQYTTQIIANSSIVALLNEGLIRPLDNYIADSDQFFKNTQLISIDGEVMAIAFMANAQHLFYREDILREAGITTPPATYEEVLAAARRIKDLGILEYPVGGTYKAGWNLGEEFVNMYFGYGGELFKSGSAEPNINNATGEATLAMMQRLALFMNPDFLTHDSNAIQAEFEAGNIALANLWGSRAAAVTDNEGSTPAIAGAIKFAGAPTVGGGDIPATTMWWDGFTVAKNISDEDARATFDALAHGASAEIANANSDAAVWLTDGFQPGPAAGGVLASAEAGARPYPMLPYIGLLHTALGNELVEFMQGRETAKQALRDVEAAYTAAAKEAGFLQ